MSDRPQFLETSLLYIWKRAVWYSLYHLQLFCFFLQLFLEKPKDKTPDISITVPKQAIHSQPLVGVIQYAKTSHRYSVFPNVSHVFEMIFRRNCCLHTTYVFYFSTVKILLVSFTPPKIECVGGYFI